MFSMGNEHAGDWDFLGRMVERAKRLDPTRQYVASSNEYIRPGEHGIPVNPNDDYAVIMFGAEKNHKRPRIRYMERMTPDNEDFHRDADYRDILEGFKIPVIAHELGQWWIYPDFKEIEKYTGVLEAKNFEIFRDSVKAGGMLGQNEELHMVSGKLAMELYKEDIERELRTPKLGGFQLLDLHDYSGQGTALVGILDAFWDSKGLITPAEFREFCAPTVILARIPQQVYEEGQTILVPMEVCHYGAQILENTAIEKGAGPRQHPTPSYSTGRQHGRGRCGSSGSGRTGPPDHPDSPHGQEWCRESLESMDLSQSPDARSRRGEGGRGRSAR